MLETIHSLVEPEHGTDSYEFVLEDGTVVCACRSCDKQRGALERAMLRRRYK